MDLDPLSIITPARVKVLLLPVGNVRQSRFEGFVQRLQSVNVVRLGDVSPDRRPHRTMFSPLAFPEGLVLYDLSASLPPPSHSALAPFELHREALVIIGLADGDDSGLHAVQTGQNKTEDVGVEENVSKLNGLRSLVRTLEDLIDEFSKALVHQILVFDHDDISMPERIYPVPTPAKSKTTTIKTVMCDLTSRLLAEMAIYAKSLQALHSLDSPRVSSNVAATTNGITSALPTHMTNLLRNESPRSFSPVGDLSKADYRTSMPANLPSNTISGVSTPSSRPTSSSNGTRTPPTSFNELAGQSRIQSPPHVSNHERADSRGGVSVTGHGAGIGERERNKGKGRVGIVIGAMYLLAGRWPDAVKELVQSAAIARNTSDYVWHAKSMDYVLVCLLMYAWSGMDFRIPENLFPGTEKSGSSSSKSSRHTTSSSLPDLNISKSVDSVNRAASLRNLTNLLPALANNILNLYNRAWTFTDEKLPPLVFSQSAIRLAKLLGGILRCHGVLDDVVLRHLVLNADLPEENAPSATAPFLTKGEVVELLFRGYPGPPSETSLPVADYTTILAGIASVLSDLGYHRKKALVLKEIMTGLLPALVQARKEGAAEMGVHPAASLASLNATVSAVHVENSIHRPDDSEQGMRHFLAYVCRSYGLMPLEPTSDIEGSGAMRQNCKLSKEKPDSSQAQLAEATASRALWQASAKAFGSQDLKIDVLRSCIKICEALPDLCGALQYSAELLRVGGSGVAPGPESSDGSPDLAVEEQVRLVNNISRTLSAAKQLGFEHPEAEYWDDFLVRGIEAVDVKSSRSLQSHAKTELELVDSNNTQDKTPFIYNPSLKNQSSLTKESPLVAMEERLFRVTLQNLYDFDVVVERVKFLADGVPLDCEAQSTIIGPYKTQTIILSATPLLSGSLTIHGCLAKIRGCRERGYPTVAAPWALRSDAKGRYSGLAWKKRTVSTASKPVKGKTHGFTQGPVPSTLALNVLKAQPAVTLRSISAPQAAIMLLEGESKRFTVTLQNASHTTPADLLLLAFDDSTASRRQSALSNKELSAVEFYELELTLARKQALKWHRGEKDGDSRIDAAGEIDLEIEVLGMPGLSHGTIQVDYGHLGIPKADIDKTFYTRQLTIPLIVTVNASIELIQTDILALPSSFSLNQQTQPILHGEDSAKSLPTSSTTELETLLTRTDNSASSPPHCLLLLDLRNSWSKTLTLTLEISDPSSTSRPTLHKQHIQPNTTQRIPVPLPRLYLSNPYAPIPSLNPANKRQFVVSATKHTAEAERAMRETFWYRESLLGRLRASWKDESIGRNGAVELRALKVSPSMLAVLKLPELEIGMSITSAESTTPSTAPLSELVDIHTAGPSTYTVPISIFLTLNTHLFNRSSTPIRPLLRLQPSLANQPQNVALDLNKKLLVNGLLQRALPILGPGERTTVHTGFLALSYGTYEWRASVDEVIAVGKAKSLSGRVRAATGDFDVLSDMGRRTWVAESPCTIVARDPRPTGELATEAARADIDE